MRGVIAGALTTVAARANVRPSAANVRGVIAGALTNVAARANVRPAAANVRGVIASTRCPTLQPSNAKRGEAPRTLQRKRAKPAPYD